MDLPAVPSSPTALDPAVPPIDRLVLDCLDAGVKLRLRDDALSVRAPKDTSIDHLLPELRARRDELEAFLRADAERERRLAMGPIRHPDNDAVLSNGQERLWFLFQYEDDPANYNMFGAYRVIGDFSYQALDSALQAIMFRHQVFRSYIENYDGELVNKTAPVSRVHIPVDDLSELPEDERQAAVESWLETEAETAFDLGTYPLWRFRLVKTAEQEHIFAFSVHHIVCDGLSELILLGELDHWYSVFLADPDAEAPEIPVRYCDFAAWQKTYLGSMRYLEDLSWWRRSLAGAPPMLEVPTDKPRPPLGSNAGGWVNFEIETEITEGLWQIGRDAGTTTYMVGLSLFGLILRDFSGQDDLVVGTPVSNRNHPDLETLVGFFVNSVPIRLGFDKDQTFRELVSATSTSALDSFDHQHVPFEHLVDELGVRREPSYNPIFQTMFAMEDAPEEDDDPDDQLGDLRLVGLDFESDSTMFDLDLLLQGHEDGHLEGGFNYNSDLYHRETIERMVRRFQRVCRLVAENPDLTLGELRAPDTLDPRVLTTGVGPVVDYDLDTTLHDVIDTTIAEHADTIAAVHGDDRVSYGELDQLATAVTDRLAAAGIGDGDVVAIEAPRGIPFLAAVLAVLRRGAAYVPVDPDYPDERRTYMLTDSGASVVLRPAADSTSGDDHPAGLELTALEGQPLDPPLDGDSPIAYMIYTSGSTGRPKGAMVRHDGALNHIHAEVDDLGLGDDFVFLQTAASSSDISVWQFLGPLCYGGRTEIVDTHTLLDAPTLFGIMQRSEATIVELVPGVIQLLCEHVATLDDAERALPDLRCLLITGEAAPVPLVNWWLELYPDIPMVNAYGPTEAADDVCQAIITEPVDPEARSVTIGRALANLSLYILDDDLDPVPFGAAGEVCITGVGVGAGYCRQPDKTERAFVENPFATGTRDRWMYRTGDLGRWRPDGTLDFVGRVDSQVKVRGFRLELGEITACIQSEDRVREAATILTENDTGDPLLVGYYSTVAGASLESGELRDHLKTMLPVQIVPNLLVALDDLPHLPNGKIDLHSLPRPEVAVAEAVDESELDDLEVAVRRIWIDLLGAPNLPLDADFFDWGGHSLLVVRLLAKVREQFNKEVSVGEFFAQPTLREFCRVVAETEESTDAVHLVASNKTRYPLSPGQARLWFLDLFEEDAATYNMPGALRFRGHLDLDAFNRALTAIVERHPSMRTRIDVENGVPFQEILPAGPVEVPVVDLRGTAPDEIDARVRERIEALLDTVFQLDEAPLWRFEIVQVSDDDVYLLNVAHHIITDGLSNELLIGELVALYAHELLDPDGPDPLEPLEFQYGDYAEWQLALQSTNRHRRQLLYWERKLAGAPALLDLPTDRPRPATQTYDGDDVSFAIDPDIVPALRELAAERSATMFMLFQAAMAAVLRLHAGQDDIVVGTPIGGRRLAELESIVGFFVNTVVIRSQVEPDAGFDALLDQVRTSAIEAFDHRDVPFEQIVERVAAERNPSFSPIFQVMVAYEEDTSDGDDLAGVEVEAIELHEATAMFDLDVLFDDDGGDEIECTIVYNTDLFDEATVAGLGRHLNALLAAAAADPSAPLDSIDVLDADGVAELVALERGPAPTWSHDRTIVDEILHRFTERPSAPAVTDGRRSLDYAALDADSAHLAAALADEGAGRGRFVAIAMDRSTELVATIVATLRSGAAYVPVDPTYPLERVAHMLNDSAADVVVTTADHLDTVVGAIDGDRTVLVVPGPETDAESTAPTTDAPAGCRVVWLTPHDGDATFAPVEVAPDDPAYLLYTSGSTGRPKGAIISHRGQRNHILAEAALLDLDDSTVFAQTAPASSDISVWQFLGPLVLGGTTAVIGTADLLLPERLVQRLDDDRVTLIELVPALFDHLLDHVDELDDPAPAVAVLQRLRAAMITGEAAPPATVDRWLAVAPDVPVINAYGPTEASDDVCQHVIDAPLGDTTRGVPIGTPVHGMQLLVLDEQLRRVPRGVRGEFCVAGVGVGHGYWRRPDLTAAAFVDNPHAEDELASTLYRTGDIGRWNRDGELEYLGRRDGQVNLLGMRIELGEIESVLTGLADVREAAVIVTDDDHPRLVAFWVPTAGDPDPDDLADAVRTQLPSHMVPRSWVRLAALPRTPIGKVDHARLPVTAAEVAFTAQEYQAPTTDDEAAMTTIWAEVLDTEQVSANAEFFELGGNSLLAVVAVRRIGDHFDVEMPLVEFFRNSTVPGLLDTIERLRVEAAAAEAELDDVEV